MKQVKIVKISHIVEKTFHHGKLAKPLSRPNSMIIMTMLLFHCTYGSNPFSSLSWSNLKFESLPFLISNHLSFQKLDMNVWLRDCIVRATKDVLMKLFRNRVPFAHIHPDAGTARGGKNPAQRILLTFSLRKNCFLPFRTSTNIFFQCFWRHDSFCHFHPSADTQRRGEAEKSYFCDDVSLLLPRRSFWLLHCETGELFHG